MSMKPKQPINWYLVRQEVYKWLIVGFILYWSVFRMDYQGR